MGSYNLDLNRMEQTNTSSRKTRSISCTPHVLSVRGQLLEFEAATFGPQAAQLHQLRAVRSVPILADADLSNAAEADGAIVVIERGHCPFHEKVRRAADAGAAGVIVINTITMDDPTGAPFEMAGDDDADEAISALPIPAVMVGASDGSGALCADVDDVSLVFNVQPEAFHAERPLPRPVIPAVPVCPRSAHVMTVSSYAEEGYASGYLCNYCAKHPGVGARWFCAECHDDICFECRPQLAADGLPPVPVPASPPPILVPTSPTPSLADAAASRPLEYLSVALSPQDTLFYGLEELAKQSTEVPNAAAVCRGGYKLIIEYRITCTQSSLLTSPVDLAAPAACSPQQDSDDMGETKSAKRKQLGGESKCGSDALMAGLTDDHLLLGAIGLLDKLHKNARCRQTVNPQLWVNAQLSAKLAKQLADPITVAANHFPNWCRLLPRVASFLFELGVRKVCACACV
jgi:hypothetical protein